MGVVLPCVRREGSCEEKAIGIGEARILVRVQDRQIAFRWQTAAFSPSGTVDRHDMRALRLQEEQEQQEPSMGHAGATKTGLGSWMKFFFASEVSVRRKAWRGSPRTRFWTLTARPSTLITGAW